MTILESHLWIGNSCKYKTSLNGDGLNVKKRTVGRQYTGTLPNLAAMKRRSMFD